MMADWKTISSKIVLKNPWFRVRHDEVVRPNGTRGEYNVIETAGPAVFVVPLTSQHETFLVQQMRYTTGKISWEVPGGNAGDERPEEAAERELQEETGIVAKKMTELGSAFPFNGLSSQKIILFLAEELEETSMHAKEEDGITRVKKFPFTEVLQMIKNGEIVDSQSILVLLKAAFHLGYRLEK